MLLIVIKDKVWWKTIPQQQHIEESNFVHHILTDMDVLEFIEVYNRQIEELNKRFRFPDREMMGSFSIVHIRDVHGDIEKWKNHQGFKCLSFKVMLREDNHAPAPDASPQSAVDHVNY